MKKGINENVNRLKYLMGILKEQTEDPEIPVGDKEKPSAIYTKIPVNWQNGKNSFELQSDENYTFDGEYKYYLLPTIVYYGSMGQVDPKSNPDVFNYGILEGTYSLIKTKDNIEIFEGKPFKVVRNSRGINYPENNTWDEIINDAKSWSIDAYFEGKDSLLKSIYEDTSNFLTPTTKRLLYSDAEPAGWSFLESGVLKDISRFEKIPEVKNGAEYVLDFNSSSKMTFFVRTPKLIRLIPIWDGSQLTFKKSNNTEKQGEIINNSSENVAKTNENRIGNGKNLLYEGVDLDGKLDGKCVEGDCVNGKGTFEFTNGDKYVGEFKDGKIDGQGTLSIKIGYKYVGQFKDNEFDGQGTYSNGEYGDWVYVGEFKDHDMNGKGTITYYNSYDDKLAEKWSEKYIGEFKDGKENGQGTKTYSWGNVYVGEFKDGRENGQGTLTYDNGTKYVGEFKDGLMYGQGTMTYDDGSKYVGEWKDAELDGQGTYTYGDGSKYVGEFKSYSYDGQGTLTYGDGSKYVGEWENNMMDGQGTYTNKEGKEFTGIWVNNTLNGKIIRIDDKLFLPTKFELVADDIYYNLIREKIPNVTIVSEPNISEQNGYLTYCDVNIKIGTKEYIAIFNEDGLSLGDTVSSKNVKAVWDNKNLTVRPFTSQEIKDAKQDSRLYSDIQLLGGDKFKMEETILRFKQLIK